MSTDLSSPDGGSPKPTAASPAKAPGTTNAPRAGQYYRVDSSRSSFTEMWRDCRSPLILIGWVCKLLRVKLPGTLNDPNVVSLRPFQVSDSAVRDTFSADAIEKLRPVVRELTELGFGQAAWFFINDLFHHSQTCQVALLHRDGQSVARVTHRCEGVATPRTHFHTEFLSALAGGEFIQSSTAPSQMFVPERCILNWNRKATVSQLWVSHRQELDFSQQHGESILKMGGIGEMINVLENHHEVIRDFHLERGVFSSMQGEDLAMAEAIDGNVGHTADGQTSQPDILARLDRLQKKQTSWASGLFVLIVSIGLFVAAGMGVWNLSWELILMVVGVLFVHECGHFLAMKIFKYSNVRMFFIPFLGAAVSGQSYDAPGWKKVCVSLAGPLPGIFLGSALGIVGIAAESELMVKIASLAIILNGIQLLPLLPLDGGRVMQAVLFSRHRHLDLVFHIIAAGILLLGAAITGDNVLIFLGALMAVGVPATYKVGKIATELREQDLATPAQATARPAGVLPNYAATTHPTTMASPVAPQSPSSSNTAVTEDGCIPKPLAGKIIAKVNKYFPRIKCPKQIANLTLRIYEVAVSRPAGVAASIGFVIVHGASFLFALMMLFTLFLAQNPELMDRAEIQATVPECSIEPGAIATWHGTGTMPASPTNEVLPSTDSGTPAPEKLTTVVATFSSSEEARALFDELKRESVDCTSLVLFGQSVLLSLPISDESARTKWLDKFESRTDDVFTAGGDNSSMILTVACMSPQAKEINERLTSFFDIPQWLYTIPPWAGEDLDNRSAEERSNHETARKMYCKLQAIWPDDTPEIEALRKDIDRATRRNDEAKSMQLYEQIDDIVDQLLLQEIEAARDSETDPIARELADRYLAIKVDEQRTKNDENTGDEPPDDEDWEGYLFRATARERNELAPLMGRLPLPEDGGHPTPQTLRYSATYGGVQYGGGPKFIVTIFFEDVSQGAPALLNWLKQRGSYDFKYELTSSITSSGNYYD